MSKLYKLKNWYSLEETAKRLTLTLGEDVSVRDVLQLAIEGHVPLGWYIRYAYGQSVEKRKIILNNQYKEGKINIEETDTMPSKLEDIVPVNENEIFVFTNDKSLDGIKEIHYSYTKNKDTVDKLGGIYYLNLEECGALKDHLLAYCTGIASDLTSLDGFWIDDEKGNTWQIVESFDSDFIKEHCKDTKYYDSDRYFPSVDFPDIAEVGFLAKDIEVFESTLNKDNKQTKTSLGTKERDTLLKLVIGMAVRGYAYDPTAKRSATTGEIKSDLDLLGINLDEDTIRKWLKESAERLPRDEDLL